MKDTIIDASGSSTDHRVPNLNASFPQTFQKPQMGEYTILVSVLDKSQIEL